MRAKGTQLPVKVFAGLREVQGSVSIAPEACVMPIALRAGVVQAIVQISGYRFGQCAHGHLNLQVQAVVAFISTEVKGLLRQNGAAVESMLQDVATDAPVLLLI